MDNDDDIDIYDDFTVVDLSKECEKLQADISRLQEENSNFINKLDTMVKEKEKLVQKNRILQKNISTLLKTAKEEIKRKDGKILELRMELSKVEAKKYVKENPVIDDKLESLLKNNIAGKKSPSQETNNKVSLAKKQNDGQKLADRGRITDKPYDRCDSRSLRPRHVDERHQRYSQRSSRSQKKSKSKSPHKSRSRNKSPVSFDRKRRRSRSPDNGKKRRRRSRSRSPKKIARPSSVRSVAVAKKILVKPVESVKTVASKSPPLDQCQTNSEKSNESSNLTTNQTKPDVKNVKEPHVTQVLDETSPALSKPTDESLVQEEGEIVSDQCDSVDVNQPKTLYSARMQRRLNKEAEEEERAKKTMSEPEPISVDNLPITGEAELILDEPKQSTVESFSPFKTNYKLIPWSPAAKPPSKNDSSSKTDETKGTGTTLVSGGASFNVEKPQNPLKLLDLLTETKKTESDIKNYRIPKKKSEASEKMNVPKMIVTRSRVTGQKPNGAVGKRGGQSGNDVKNFEIFKTINSKNSSSSSLDQSLDTRRLRSDLHLTDSDGHLDENEATTEESSPSCSDSDASDIMESI